MTGPFASRVPVPGTWRPRLVWGIAVEVVAGLALAMGACGFLWGKRSWWMILLLLGVGLWVKGESQQDPYFFRTWPGELRLKGRYH